MVKKQNDYQVTTITVLTKRIMKRACSTFYHERIMINSEQRVTLNKPYI